uniref:Kinesin motor domain-containing protein n=2 Tax=Graphocephala atropunctata TaxID=36148 RepID=A0A1B6KTC9_9HEMI
MIGNDLKNKTKLFVRVLPSTVFDWDCVKFDIDNKCIYIRYLFEFHSSLNVKTLPKFLCYQTDGIFANCCQKAVYESVVNQLLDHIYLGIDSIILSYGQNNSGKTFTTSGLYNQFELRGIVPRFLTDLFTKELDRREDFTSQIWMSAVDVQRNVVYDLFDKQKKVSKVPREVRSVQLESELHGLELLFQAEAERMIVCEKSYNAHSGTNVVTFTVKLTPLESHDSRDRSSKVHFVDLAGVETIRRNPLTSFKDQDIQGPANVSKTLLEIFALRCKTLKNPNPKIFKANQRSSILMQYLDRSLSPASCVKLICHIRPNHEDLMMTISQLKFGTTFQGIPKIEPKAHTDLNLERMLKGLQDHVKSLEDELLTRDLWNEHSPITITQGRLDFVKRRVELYVKGDLNEFELLSSVDDCNLVLSIMKDIFSVKLPIEVASIALQTNDGVEFMTKRKYSDDRRGSSYLRESTAKKSTVKDKTGSVSSPKHVGFEIPKETNKTVPTEKGKKTDAKKKTADKPELVSREVQVNLIEPSPTLPHVDSREAVWALFIISRPDLQIQIDKLNSSVVDRQKQLAKQNLNFDNINRSITQTELELHQLSTMTAFIEQEEQDVGTPTLIVTDEVTRLVKVMKSLQNESNSLQQRLIEAQTDWLEALEKLRDEKQNIEKEFKEFCQRNNFLALDDKTSSQEDVETEQSENLALDLSNYDEQNKYFAFQQKYLNISKNV